MPFFITMVISWYLVFFTPKDLFTQFLLKTRVTFIFSMAQDFQRLHLCLAGVNSVAKIHPQAFFYMIFIGGKIFFLIKDCILPSNYKFLLLSSLFYCIWKVAWICIKKYSRTFNRKIIILFSKCSGNGLLATFLQINLQRWRQTIFPIAVHICFI